MLACLAHQLASGADEVACAARAVSILGPTEMGALVVGAPAAADRGRWHVLDAAAQPITTAAGILARLAALSAIVDGAQAGSQRLVVRFEAETAAAVLPPCEVCWRGATWRDSGDHAILVHLPALGASAPPAVASWPAPAAWQVSPHLTVARDGSTWDGEVVARASAGRVAPIGPADSGAVLLRRRQVRWRSLCPWQHEVAEHRKLEATTPGFLDVDVEHGLFAFAGDEPPPIAPVVPPPAAGARAPNLTCITGPISTVRGRLHPGDSGFNSEHSMPPGGGTSLELIEPVQRVFVTVEYQQGASAHIGALPAERSTILGRRPEPATRIVSRHGVAGGDAVSAALAVPRYRTLTDALAAIDADAARAEEEVVELADSATYVGEAPAWPGTGGGGNATRRLVIRAADGARPVVRLDAWTAAAGAGFTRIVLRGVTLAANGALTLAPPMVDPPSGSTPAQAGLELTLSTIATVPHPTTPPPPLALAIAAPPRGVHVTIDRAITGPLTVTGEGALRVRRSIVDPGASTLDAIVVADGMAEIDRSTVLGAVDVGVLEASESIFLGVVTVTDRFRGCIRFSRVEVGSVLPRRHRVVPDLDVSPPVPVPVRLVSIDRHDPAYGRLTETCDVRVRTGAADGAEMGAFHDELWPVRREAVLRRLSEYTPAGMVTGLIRMD